MTASDNRRRPRVFAPDDPSLDIEETAVEPAEISGDGATARSAPGSATGAGALPSRPTIADIKRGFGWGGLLLSALTGLVVLGIGAWFARLVSAALARDDIIGWTAYGLAVVAMVATLVLVAKELVGFSRLARLRRIKRDVTTAIAAGDAKAERDVVRRIRGLYQDRDDLRWALARFREHEKDVHDAGGLMALAERELVAPLDGQARRVILKSAKRVSVVTALSPIFFFAVLYVLVENVRMLRGLATLYGGRPGFFGALRLARMVVVHIIATGGIAMTDDLVGQFVGQDLLRRLSHRLGEGVFNGALTSRVGVAAIEVCRPLPFIEATPVRVRDLMSEVVRNLRRGEAKTDADSKPSARIDR